MTKYRRKRRVLPAAVITVIIAALLGTAGWFGWGYYQRYTHPLRYESYVEKYSRENGLDKYLVYAVIKTESGFDPGAVSNVGARGLMQIMEDTFDWVKFRLRPRAALRCAGTPLSAGSGSAPELPEGSR